MIEGDIEGERYPAHLQRLVGRYRRKQEGDSSMEIMRGGSRPSQKGPEQYFTGAVRIDPIVQAPDPSRTTAGFVTFEPGSRSAWHTHPLGQTLIVTSGVGWTQCEGEPIAEMRAGDVIWCPPNHRHW